jgi:hypothetical protein
MSTLNHTNLSFTLNHTNLTTYNVPELEKFFCSVFDFEVLEKRGDKLAVLRNSDGFLLTLMYDKRMTPEQGYPGLFHVGFLQPTQGAVNRMHEAMVAGKYEAPKPGKLQRGGPPTYGFYYEAPGGVLVEVSTMNLVGCGRPPRLKPLSKSIVRPLSTEFESAHHWDQSPRESTHTARRRLLVAWAMMASPRRPFHFITPA